ncbi:hypothetical protein ['Camptotheca acuminata' phytoplasma]|uniref:hypothetical protein n=1 Tax='Camptotheca acuminata' phytoplasma TaxID=3239192 RepID=UPI00351A8D10
MLKLENLSCYDNNQEVILKNLSFGFPEKGLFVITGDRRSKKILFDFLTYQKKQTSGYLWISQKNTQLFTHSDIAFYYNFVLGVLSSEEFFLIDELGVKSNIEIYLEIQNQNFNTKQIKEIFKEVDLLEEIELDSLVEEIKQRTKTKIDFSDFNVEKLSHYCCF